MIDKPTLVQGWECYALCQRLTTLYIPIQLVRFDATRNMIYVLAGDSIQYLISPTGQALLVPDPD